MNTFLKGEGMLEYVNLSADETEEVVHWGENENRLLGAGMQQYEQRHVTETTRYVCIFSFVLFKKCVNN